MDINYDIENIEEDLNKSKETIANYDKLFDSKNKYGAEGAFMLGSILNDKDNKTLLKLILFLLIMLIISLVYYFSNFLNFIDSKAIIAFLILNPIMWYAVFTAISIISRLQAKVDIQNQTEKIIIYKYLLNINNTLKDISIRHEDILKNHDNVLNEEES